jgi:hypothetical protein
MLFSKALISYSRVLTNEATSSSPVVEMAASLDCTEISLISWVFWRFRPAEDMGIAFRLWPTTLFAAEVMTLSKSSRRSELTQSSISQVYRYGVRFLTRRGSGATPRRATAACFRLRCRPSKKIFSPALLHRRLLSQAQSTKMGVSKVWYTLFPGFISRCNRS